MIRAKLSDKKYIVEMMQSSFSQNPTFKAITKDNRRIYLKRLIIEWAFHYAYARNGVYMSHDKTSCAFFYNSNEKGGLIELWYKLKFILLGIKWSKLIEIINHFAKIENAKPKDMSHFHFWFLGSTDKSTFSSTKSFIEELFLLAKNQKMPIYAETTIAKNKTVFMRYGMKVYGKVESVKLDLRAYLLLWMPAFVR